MMTFTIFTVAMVPVHVFIGNLGIKKKKKFKASSCAGFTYTFMYFVAIEQPCM